MNRRRPRRQRTRAWWMVAAVLGLSSPAQAAVLGLSSPAQAAVLGTASPARAAVARPLKNAGASFAWAADSVPGSPASTPSALEITAAPVLGDSSLVQGYFAEFFVSIRNRGGSPRAGEVVIVPSAYSASKPSRAKTRAEYTVAAGAAVQLHLPVRLETSSLVRVVDEQGRAVFEQSFPHAGHGNTVLVDVDRASALGDKIAKSLVGSATNPWATRLAGGTRWHPPGPAPRVDTAVEVARALYDDATGEPLLPLHAAGYSRIAAVVIRSNELVLLSAARLDALASWVLSGGTLAVATTRSEDLRHATIAAFVGGAAVRTRVHEDTLAPVLLKSPSTYPAPRPPPRDVPTDTAPTTALVETLSGYQGGNLQPSSYGASASYGLGEVHLLAFDPQRLPGVETSFVHVRMIDILRRANERQSSVLCPPGEPEHFNDSVARALDPNETSRWSILLATLLLCVYAGVAGPLNFALWRRRNRPLMALSTLPIASAVTFALIVGIGLAAKGCTGRARRLTLVETGAGMTLGTARTWRSFYVPVSTKLAVWAEEAASVVGIARDDFSDAPTGLVKLERDGMGLEALELRPWETTLVREDRTVQLGGGVALSEGTPDEVMIINRSGRALRGMILVRAPSTYLFAARLEDGARLSSKQMVALSLGPTPASPFGFQFQPEDARVELDEASAGAADAWKSLVSQVVDGRAWFPGDVPVLLAQLEGGEGKRQDSGLPIESDRLLVRVVGFGGAP
ncbi:MAG: hypothetical protein EXR75_01105 [Myxococcales bacterium]|nr:hypothetical protein [Myxococcales bacterium]